MTLALGTAHLAAMRDHGRRAYPEECCGVLLGTMSCGQPTAAVTGVLAVDNVHDGHRERRFVVSPEDYLRAERQARRDGCAVIGFYHSHPDHPARPSEVDREQAWPNLHYVIVEVAAGEPRAVTSWLLAEDRTAFLEERLLTLPTSVRHPKPSDKE